MGDQQRIALHDAESLPLHEPGSVESFGPTLVVAPHPDDESLGCGGAIALLREHDVPVRVAVMSDGCGSHPNSKKYGPETLRELRESEALAALEILGVAEENVRFLRFPDTAVPDTDSVDLLPAIERFQGVLMADPVPETILLPWHRDPHHDHRASWQIVIGAQMMAALRTRHLEYPIWLWDLGEPDDMPRGTTTSAWRLDISTVLDRKKAAIAAHRSQTTRLIDDDPGGFMLSPETLEHFYRPWEIFLEPRL